MKLSKLVMCIKYFIISFVIIILFIIICSCKSDNPIWDDEYMENLKNSIQENSNRFEFEKHPFPNRLINLYHMKDSKTGKEYIVFVGLNIFIHEL